MVVNLNVWSKKLLSMVGGACSIIHDAFMRKLLQVHSKNYYFFEKVVEWGRVSYANYGHLVERLEHFGWPPDMSPPSPSKLLVGLGWIGPLDPPVILRIPMTFTITRN